ncbi:hypothetical protein [Nitrospirillum viridazoti]|uniref:hypothetical protein n=1 Tax=Nitrospirillum viridazoti TaxID=3144925 RepID=UPI0011A42894|nr:hypothetical protein [Nitrospirillum amazonense]
MPRARRVGYRLRAQHQLGHGVGGHLPRQVSELVNHQFVVIRQGAEAASTLAEQGMAAPQRY